MGTKFALTLLGAIAIAMTTAGAAWACTNLATLNLSESAVTPGQTIQVTGSSFRTAERGGQPVVFHWSSPDGAVLAEAAPDPTGQVVASVKIPADAQPGFYAMVATQNVQEQDGHLVAGGVSPAFGTPARASVQVGNPAPAQVAATPSTPAAATDGSPALLLALTGLLAFAGIGLFAAGATAFVHQIRGREVPVPARTTE